MSRVGSGRVGSGRVGSGPVGSGRAGSYRPQFTALDKRYEMLKNYQLSSLLQRMRSALPVDLTSAKFMETGRSKRKNWKFICILSGILLL